MVFIHAIAGSNPAATTIGQKRSHLWLVFCLEGGREGIAHPAATTIFVAQKFQKNVILVKYNGKDEAL